MKGISNYIILCFLLILVSFNSRGQIISGLDSTREYLISVSRKIMQGAEYCALTTLDSTGQPRVRTMDPFPPDENMEVWFGTNPMSRKVLQINNDPRVTLYYFDKERGGYVLIMGKAFIINDPGLKKLKWKEGWSEFYPDQDESYALIRVIPEVMEILSPEDNILGDTETWKPPEVRF